MKKSTKIILSAAACLLCAGLALTLVGRLLGASYSQIIHDDMWIWQSGEDGIGSSYDSDRSRDNTYSIDPAGIDQLSVDWLSGDIRIQAYDGDQILVKESCKTDIDEENCLRYRIKNGSLDISCCREKVGISFGSQDEKQLVKNLVIKVPRALADDLKEISIDTVSADLSASGLTVKEFSADSVSGNVTLEKCAVTDLEADTTSGDILLALLRCPNAFEADSTSGDVCLQLPHKSSFYLEYDTVSGDASIEGFDAKCLEEDDDYGEYQVGKGGGSFSISTVSGDITVTRAGHH